jgi:multidrug transporter EmrE-like cation transporter
MNQHFDANWPGRLIGFGIGVIVFTIMSWLLFKEHPTPKTLVCLGLAFTIVILQIFWK